ncbi:hypothetical protein KSP40_PGU020944 [Platanthera guangdongensis]|uniref:Uncharacterized protein n=1 Tax=Platanthera guangdongensis TaxID=2320717 RepID=A0ABR2MEX9_9ASPA
MGTKRNRSPMLVEVAARDVGLWRWNVGQLGGGTKIARLEIRPDFRNREISLFRFVQDGELEIQQLDEEVCALRVTIQDLLSQSTELALNLTENLGEEKGLASPPNLKPRGFRSASESEEQDGRRCGLRLRLRELIFTGQAVTTA